MLPPRGGAESDRCPTNGTPRHTVLPAASGSELLLTLALSRAAERLDRVAGRGPPEHVPSGPGSYPWQRCYATRRGKNEVIKLPADCAAASAGRAVCRMALHTLALGWVAGPGREAGGGQHVASPVPTRGQPTASRGPRGLWAVWPRHLSLSVAFYYNAPLRSLHFVAASSISIPHLVGVRAAQAARGAAQVKDNAVDVYRR